MYDTYYICYFTRYLYVGKYNKISKEALYGFLLTLILKLLGKVMLLLKTQLYLFKHTLRMKKII